MVILNLKIKDFTGINFGVKINKIPIDFCENYVYDATLNKAEPLRGGDGKPRIIKR